MKKIILLLAVTCILGSCEKKEEKSSESEKKDTLTSEKEKNLTNTDLTKINCYLKSKGIMLTDSVAVLAIALPNPSLKNIFTIKKVYNVSDASGNKILIHLNDSLKDDSKCHFDNFEKFIIDFKKTNQFDNNGNPILLDFKKEITVAVFFDNDPIDMSLLNHHFSLAQNTICIECEDTEALPEPTKIEKKDTAPKTYGMGTIKPY